MPSFREDSRGQEDEAAAGPGLTWTRSRYWKPHKLKHAATPVDHNFSRRRRLQPGHQARRVQLPPAGHGSHGFATRGRGAGVTSAFSTRGMSSQSSDATGTWTFHPHQSKALSQPLLPRLLRRLSFTTLSHRSKSHNR